MTPPDRFAFLDLETTSTDVSKCEIIEVAIVQVPFTFFSDDNRVLPDAWEFMVDPGVPIPPESTSIHGITDEMVRGRPPFREWAEEVQAALDGAVLVGYNLRKFDSVIMDLKLRTCGYPGLERADPKRPSRITHPEIDLLQLWHRFEPRTLRGALVRFVGGDLAAWKDHSAAGDVSMLPLVLGGMGDAIDGWPERSEERPIGKIEELCTLSVPDDEVDRGGFMKRVDGTVTMAKGKYLDKPAIQVPHDYWDWMLQPGRDFLPDTLEIARYYRERRRSG